METTATHKSVFSKHPIITGGLLLAGAGLAYVGVKAIKSNLTNGVARDVHIETSIAIDKSPAELFNFWRNFKNLPLFMKHLESVADLGGGKSHWIASGAGGVKVEWDAKILNEVENELIAWRSLETSDVTNAGSVRFEQAPNGRGCFVRVTMNYNPPAGKVGAAVAGLLGSEPKQLIKDDLRRLKQILETGEIATVEGQSSGRQSSIEANEPSSARELVNRTAQAKGQTA